MKTIIAVSATGQKGKTTAIMRLAKEFPLSEREYFDYDGRALSEAEAVKMNKVLCRGVYEGKRIGFSSEGDNWSLVEHGLCTLTGSPAFAAIASMCSKSSNCEPSGRAQACG